MKPLRRLAAGTLLAAAIATGILTTASIALADAATGTTVTTPGADDTWWGTQPANPATAAPDGSTAVPLDTWWG